MPPTDSSNTLRYYFRFRLSHRLLHGLLMGSFLGLAATGMPLRFPQNAWAVSFTHAVGGFRAILFFHLTFAVLLTLCFFLHLGQILHAAIIKKEAGIFWGPTSLVPQPKDLRDLLQHFRWFLGLGAKPRFDRFTYWEKFDYWAVFWGMAIIGTSGYMMWFSSFFGRFVPGWIFNITLLIHADEALLAVWFIFAIHFFNGHLRPGNFPMDRVIFTGRLSERELEEKHPEEYKRRIAAGSLAEIAADPPPDWLDTLGKIVGSAALAIGFLLLVLTLLAFVAN